MSNAGLSKARLGRMHDVLSGHVERGEVPDDYLAFGRMLLNKGRHGRERILSRPSIEAMITDQLTAVQKAASPFSANFWDSHGWGFGVAIVTQRDSISSTPGRFGWDGGYGTSWASDPAEEMWRSC